MKFFTPSLLAAGTTLALLAGSPAMAQPKDPAARHEHMSQHRSEHLAKRQEQLKAALKITAAQEAVWTRYVQAQQPHQHGQPADREAWAKLTTPQRLDQMQAHKAERDARMTAMVEATRALYAALDSNQQKVFDSQAPMAGMGMGSKHRGEPGAMGHERRGMHHGG